MKKYLILPVIAFAAMVVPAHAATLDFAPQTVSVTTGETVTVTVAVDPAGATVSAVEAHLTYPDTLLTATGFTLAPNWVAMTQSGFDQMGGGTIVKSAGYPGGVTATTTYGTLTFTAKATGKATIAVEGVSGLYNEAGDNVLSGTQGTAIVTIATSTSTTGGSTGTGGGSTTSTTTATSTSSTAPTTTSTTKPSTTNTPSNVTTTQTAETQTAVNTGAPASTTTATTTGASGLLATATPLAAAAGAAPGAGFFGSVWGWLLLLLIILAAGGLWYYYNRRNSEGSVSPLSVSKK